MYLPIDQFTKKEGLPSFCVLKTFILSFFMSLFPDNYQRERIYEQA